MEKDQFIHVVQHFPGSSVHEAQEVLSLKDIYPYSQLLHALSARVSKEHGFSTHGGELQLAAVYAADRAVLKEIMLEDFEPETRVTQGTGPTESTSLSDLHESRINTAAPIIEVDGDDLAEEVLHDLERLNELKHNFEKLFTDGAPSNSNTVASAPIVIKDVQKSAVENQPVALEPDYPVAQESKPMSKKERIVALAKALEQRKSAEQPETKPKSVRRKRKHEGEELMDEIVNSKAQIEPENAKQKEQIDLIDHFIKSQPSIMNSKDKPLPEDIPDDLSTTNNAEFGDNIISETLVEILLKQGKKDRAIEVLKKLIWKFPQKKAYFAAQIEDLKK